MTEMRRGSLWVGAWMMQARVPAETSQLRDAGWAETQLQQLMGFCCLLREHGRSTGVPEAGTEEESGGLGSPGRCPELAGILSSLKAAAKPPPCILPVHPLWPLLVKENQPRSLSGAGVSQARRRNHEAERWFQALAGAFVLPSREAPCPSAQRGWRTLA